MTAIKKTNCILRMVILYLHIIIPNTHNEHWNQRKDTKEGRNETKTTFVETVTDKNLWQENRKGVTLQRYDRRKQEFPKMVVVTSTSLTRRSKFENSTNKQYDMCKFLTTHVAVHSDYNMVHKNTFQHIIPYHICLQQEQFHSASVTSQYKPAACTYLLFLSQQQDTYLWPGGNSVQHECVDGRWLHRSLASAATHSHWTPGPVLAPGTSVKQYTISVGDPGPLKF